LFGKEMSEGSLEAPVRHPIAWQEPDFYDSEKLDTEMRRVFDICHGCRRCFNLCDSFPRLFDLIDDTESGELDAVDSVDFKQVVDACTLCDMCFMVKCPYVPPHEFDLDFPHLMLRYRAWESKNGNISKTSQQLTETDRNGKLGCKVSSVANWACDTSNNLTRPLMQAIAGIHKEAVLPTFNSTPLDKVEREKLIINSKAPAFGRKAVIFATCFGNYNNTAIGEATIKVLAKNGVETEIIYPRCCGMPQLEQGNISAVAKSAEATAIELCEWIERGYDVIALVSSCALMLKFEWPLIVPKNKSIKLLSINTFDISEYLVSLSKKEGLAEGMKPIKNGVAVHMACHARAQNMGQKAAELLRLVPDTKISVIERCSGHGGSWGVMKENYEVALKIGKPVYRDVKKLAPGQVVSECPLARDHIIQGLKKMDGDTSTISQASHPVELIAQAYDL
jgi:glycerol-3-phosphate dehydrogenase subunit C